MKEYNIKIGTAFLLVAAYFGVMIFYTFLYVAVWRKVFPDFSNIINIITIAICICVFVVFLKRRTGYQMQLLSKEQDYQEMIQSLIKSPMTSLIQVCVLAPIVEEILMRGVVLGGLKKSYGCVTALLISAILFAFLHFNMVQTLSAFICGIVLGLLYIKKDSIFCCMLAHCGYNLTSYIVMIYPHIKWKGYKWEKCEED